MDVKRRPVIKVVTVIAQEVIMQLKKQSNPSARWDQEKNSWSIGTSDEYQWFHEKTKEHSSWMDLDDALLWIKEHDEKR